GHDAVPTVARFPLSSLSAFAEVPGEVGGIEAAAGASVTLVGAGKNPGGPQANEALFRRAGPAAQDSADDLAQLDIAGNRRQHPAQVIAVDPVGAGCPRLEGSDLGAVGGQFVEAEAQEV